jgi:hypothetical protein
MQAVQLGWLRRLLLPTPAPWKAAVWASLSASVPLAFKTHPWTLLHSSMAGKQIAFSGPTSVWRVVIQLWRDLDGGSMMAPCTHAEVLAQPIFHNAHLRDPAGNTLLPRGVALRFPSALRTVGQLWSTLSGTCVADARDRTRYPLICSVPPAWSALLRAPPTTTSGDAFWVNVREDVGGNVTLRAPQTNSWSPFGGAHIAVVETDSAASVAAARPPGC